MATIRQKIAFKEVLKGSSLTKAMSKAGYADTTASTTGKLTNTKGFKELCDKLGLTDELLTKSLVDDIEAKPQNRYKELELGFKIKGRLKDNENNGNIYNTVIINDSQRERIARRAIARIRRSEESPDRLSDSDE